MPDTAYARVEISDVRHTEIHGDKTTYCGHPRQGGIFGFGEGEIAVIHNHAPCAYKSSQDVTHGELGYHGRSVVLLQRSLDNGETWPQELEVPIWNEAAPVPERRQRLFPGESVREEIDLSKRESIVFFGRSHAGDECPDDTPDGVHQMICFALRSPDKGCSWERVPTIVKLSKRNAELGLTGQVTGNSGMNSPKALISPEGSGTVAPPRDNSLPGVKSKPLQVAESKSNSTRSHHVVSRVFIPVSLLMYQLPSIRTATLGIMSVPVFACSQDTVSM